MAISDYCRVSSWAHAYDCIYVNFRPWGIVFLVKIHFTNNHQGK